MKNMLLLQANYNYLANKNMCEILCGIDNALLTKDCGLYFGSIIETLKHSMAAEIGIFIKRFSQFAATPPKNMDSLIASLKLLKSINDMKKLSEILLESNQAVIEIIQNTQDFSSREVLQLSEVAFEKSRGYMYLSILNHSIHHRGQIAGALDALKIDNDFGGMLGMPLD
ncbi:MAG: damage-inducible protein DinB [Helicobacter sp.]|nr:damage-inducible protein DinB [Helicobacter sp.]